MPTINVPYEGGTLIARIVSDPTPPVMTTSTDADWITGTGTTTTATTSLVVAANATYQTRTATVTVSGITQEDAGYRGRASASSAWTIVQAGSIPPYRRITFDFRDWNFECDTLPEYFDPAWNSFDMYITSDMTDSQSVSYTASHLESSTSNPIYVGNDHTMSYTTSNYSAHTITFEFHRDNMDYNGGLYITEAGIEELNVTVPCSVNRGESWYATYEVPSGVEDVTIVLNSHNPNFVLGRC